MVIHLLGQIVDMERILYVNDLIELLLILSGIINFQKLKCIILLHAIRSTLIYSLILMIKISLVGSILDFKMLGSLKVVSQDYGKDLEH